MNLQVQYAVLTSSPAGSINTNQALHQQFVCCHSVSLSPNLKSTTTGCSSDPPNLDLTVHTRTHPAGLTFPAEAPGRVTWPSAALLPPQLRDCHWECRTEATRSFCDPGADKITHITACHFFVSWGDNTCSRTICHASSVPASSAVNTGREHTRVCCCWE